MVEEITKGPEPKPKKLSRRRFLQLMGAGVVVKALSGCAPLEPAPTQLEPGPKPVPEPTPTSYVPPQREPIPTPPPEKEPALKNWEPSQETLDQVGRGLLNPSQYAPETIKGMENLLRSGSGGQIFGYNVDGRDVYLLIEPEGKLKTTPPLIKIDATARTDIQVGIFNLRPEGADSEPHVLVRLQSLRDRNIWREFGSKNQAELNDIDSQHEAIVTLVYGKGLGLLLRRCGINPDQSLPDQSIGPDDHNELIKLLETIFYGLHPYAEATAEIFDAPLIAKLAEKDRSGNFKTSGGQDDSGKARFVPVIDGKPYNDYGHFMALVRTLDFPAVWEAPTPNQIPFDSIPPQNLENYLTYIKEAFSSP